MSQLVVVLGAGASKDSSGGELIRDSTWVPPLVTELFDPRYRVVLDSYPWARLAAAEVRREKNSFALEQLIRERYLNADNENDRRSFFTIPPRGRIGRSARTPGPGRQSWNTWPVIIPPIYAKQALRARIQGVWDDARDAIQACDRLVFFGYSLPITDVEAEKLFERAISANTGGLAWADVVNPAPESAQRYAGLAPALPIRWYSSVSKFIARERAA